MVNKKKNKFPSVKNYIIDYQYFEKKYGKLQRNVAKKFGRSVKFL